MLLSVLVPLVFSCSAPAGSNSSRPKVTHGFDISIADAPYFAALYSYEFLRSPRPDGTVTWTRTNAIHSTCGASILDEHHILSAAHCFSNALRRQFNEPGFAWSEESFFVVGTADVQATEDSLEGQRLDIAEVFLPDAYCPFMISGSESVEDLRSISADVAAVLDRYAPSPPQCLEALGGWSDETAPASEDIAVIRTKQAIVFKPDGVRPARLVEPDAPPPAVGDTAWLVGLGSLDAGSGEKSDEHYSGAEAVGTDENEAFGYPSRLQGAVVTLQDSGVFPNLTADERKAVIASGPGQVDACGGDSGGPLMGIRTTLEERSDPPGRYADEPQIGVVSAATEHSGAYCGEAGVYASVALHRPWIDTVLRGEAADVQADHCALNSFETELAAAEQARRQSAQEHCPAALIDELEALPEFAL